MLPGFLVLLPYLQIFRVCTVIKPKRALALGLTPADAQNKRSGLFWFVPSFLFTQVEHKDDIAPYLAQPEMIFQRIWALPETLDAKGAIAQVSKHSLLDGENAMK